MSQSEPRRKGGKCNKAGSIELEPALLYPSSGQCCGDPTQTDADTNEIAILSPQQVFAESEQMIQQQCGKGRGGGLKRTCW